ncbi:MAG: glutamine-hydrolyzing carbamoyl-phosphate synthase small subunit [Deltaproteobacteria bacterium]|nr:glutamine-hydrolyzing carbamoyl-phosphate synthase small subunit [Deltaproteobacteria bacterium]
MKAKLALEDGRIFEGRFFGAKGIATGEVVFNTSMTGYQEVLTDPSYYGQMVAMTSPHIGNYGVNRQDQESARPWVRALIVREAAEFTTNWRSRIDLDRYLKQRRIIGITGIDTRALTRHIRDKGAMRGAIVPFENSDSRAIELAASSRAMKGADLVSQVTCKSAYRWRKGFETGWSPWKAGKYGKTRNKNEKAFKVVAYDFGVKINILRSLAHFGCELIVVPAGTSWKQVLSMEPDGVFFSNGPGDPAAVTYGIMNAEKLIAKVPLFGICLGHQILSLALGARTFKLKFGHRGGNQPVKRLKTGTIEITAQNHGFAVDTDSLPGSCSITHVNLNDATCEGFEHSSLPLFAVQYHPEASPGPHDAAYLFDKFMQLMRDHSH